MLGEATGAVGEAPSQMLPHRFGPGRLRIWAPLYPFVQQRKLIRLEANAHQCAASSAGSGSAFPG